MKRKIVKIDFDPRSNGHYQVRDLMEHRDKKLYVSFKVGRRRKIKRFHIVSYATSTCDICGSHEYITWRVGGKEYTYSDR